MSNALEDFLRREEARRNRSLSKRFRKWLSGESAAQHVKQLDRILATGQADAKAAAYLRKAEDAYKSDETHRKQDNKRKKSLKIFQAAFEKWLLSDKGTSYLQQIDTADSPQKKEWATQDAEKAFARANPHLLPEDYRDLSKTRIRPVRHARARDLDDISFDVIEPGLNQLGLVTSTILRNWEKIVGEALAQNTRPERVIFPPKSRSHGTLYIMARQGFNTIIQHHAAQIIFRINSHFGFAAVSDVRISKRYFVEMETSAERAAQQVIAKRISPAPRLDTKTQGMIDHVKDPDYRVILEKLGKLVKARNQ